MVKVKKITHIITGLKTGGAELSLFNLLSWGLSSQYDSTVVSLDGLGKTTSLIENLGVPVITLNFRKPARWFVNSSHLKKAISRINPDLVQGWMYHGNLASHFYKKHSRGKCLEVWNVRHSMDNYNKEKLTTKYVMHANRIFSNKVDKIIYNSEFSRDTHEGWGFASGNSIAIPNGVDFHKFNSSMDARISVRKKHSIPLDAFVVGHVGRFHPIKDHATFLKAMVKVLQKNESTHAVLCGSGVTYTNRIISDLIPSRFVERVHLLGERNDMPRIFSSFDVFCQTSLSESFPNVLLEAMSTCVPCIVTNVGDSKKIIGDTGSIIPTQNEEKIHEVILDYVLMATQELIELGKQARERIEYNYKNAVILKKYSNLYEQLFNSRT
jgi:glycosyltransferase involved in cell wall biosynthesis